jgi:hypothetical protein
MTQKKRVIIELTEADLRSAERELRDENRQKALLERNYAVSATAYSTGWGTMPWRWVCGMTPDERQTVRTGSAVVLMRGCPGSDGFGRGTHVREILTYGDRFTHIMPSEDMIKWAVENGYTDC